MNAPIFRLTRTHTWRLSDTPARVIAERPVVGQAPIIGQAVGFAASGTIRISPPIIVASVVNEKFLRSTTVRHCERSEAISSTTHRPGSETAASPCGAPRNDGLLFKPSSFRTGTLVKRPKGRWLSVVILHVPRLAPFLHEGSLQADEQIAIEHSERN
jgi:hypothetical protein